MGTDFFLLLDAVGTVAFAMSGAFKAIERRLDLLGILVLGFVTAMGGGILRDVLLQKTPAAFLTNGPALQALIGCVLAGAFHYATRGKGKSLPDGRAFLIVDALGLAVFAVTGATLAHEAGLIPWAVVLLAAMTGVGGGAIRDLLVVEVPLVLHADFYATAAIFGGLVFVLLSGPGMPEGAAPAGAFAVTFFLRVMAIVRGWHLPRLPL